MNVINPYRKPVVHDPVDRDLTDLAHEQDAGGVVLAWIMLAFAVEIGLGIWAWCRW